MSKSSLKKGFSHGKGWFRTINSYVYAEMMLGFVVTSCSPKKYGDGAGELNKNLRPYLRNVAKSGLLYPYKFLKGGKIAFNILTLENGYPGSMGDN